MKKRWAQKICQLQIRFFQIFTLLFPMLLSSTPPTFASEGFGTLDPQTESGMARSYLREEIEIINQLQIQHETTYELGNVPIADRCVSFMSEDQMLGRDGRNIYENFIRLESELPLIHRGESLNRICPRYRTLSQQQKSLLWVMIMTMVAHFESSCNPAAQNKGPNGIVSGFYQMHRGKEGLYDGPEISICRNGNSGDPANIHRCALGMMEFQFEKQSGQLFSKDSYWDVLRPQGRAQKAGLIYRGITNSPLCNPKNS